MSKQSLMEKAAHEFKMLAAIVAYLWLVFAVLALHEWIVLAKFHINFRFYGFAIINSLLLAKPMLVAEDLHFGERFRERPLIYPIFYRAVMFAVLLICFYVVEEVVIGIIHGRTIARSMPDMGGGSLGWISALAVLTVVLIPYFGFKEIGRAIGQRKLHDLLFKAGQQEPDVAPGLQTPRREAPHR